VEAHRILVVGAGGREHALAWRLARDPDRPEVLVAPGRDGMRDVARLLPLAPDAPGALIEACRRERVGLVVIGPEAPLAAGLADALAAAGVPVFGPGREAARLESSKAHAKDVMREAGVPTGAAETFEALAPACAALERTAPPWVLKADGLAAGKGVCVTESRDEALEFLADCLERGRFGAAGRRVLLEEFLAGEEASVIAVCDGARAVLLPDARDHKRAFDGDRGPNTGGMGAVAPGGRVDAALEEEIGRTVFEPVLALLARRGTPFRGALYAGLMLTARGPRVVEFNVRFGDPETQVVLPLLEGDLGRLLAGAAAGRLDAGAVRRASGAAVGVVVADEGYPGAPRGGMITGLDALAGWEDVMVFHAGTQPAAEGWRIEGGRAACVVARGSGREDARARAYDALATLGGRGWRVRHDIAAAGAAAETVPAAGPGGRRDGGA
jgi:phosphoribosylamine---glycine ligase